MEYWLGSFVIIWGFGTSIAKNYTLYLYYFSGGGGGGGGGDPDPLFPPLDLRMIYFGQLADLNVNVIPT